MISIIIPTYNEASQIARTIQSTHAANGGHDVEVIVSDGGSTDETAEIAKYNGARIINSKKGRAIQMNQGASAANGELLYFLHADTVPPQNFTTHISDAYKKGAVSGCFRLSFDHDHWFLKTHCWFSRFNLNAVRFGDQSLFVTRNIFQKSGGFREDLLIMEDHEIIHRIRKHGKFTVMNAFVITSARKYLDNGIYRMQVIFYKIWLLYYLGYSQDYLLQEYRKLIRKHNL